MARRDGDELHLDIRHAGPDANRQVADGEADAAYFQHIPAFEGQTRRDGIDGLTVLARVHVVPYGLYSRSCASLDTVPHFGTVLIPAGPAPLSRGLYLLQYAKLMTLNKPFGGTALSDLTVTEANVTDSQRHLTISQADPVQFPELVDAVDLVVMNPDTARANGFDPDRPLLREPAADNPYTNVLVGRGRDSDDPALAVLAHRLEGPEISQYVDAGFGGSVIGANPARPEPEVPAPANTYVGAAGDYAGPRSCV
ncbi:MetQ/NlpA family ABC transporter substrate-binding protein [Gordonia sp. CPCC 206044]|uniref:MetQ/NlpA family ABC transporter substrate-binding protein n=1 Tax=Gordonia sp. CPCC 206044 TaxID=3140793 RepID=UPI003AF3E1B0